MGKQRVAREAQEVAGGGQNQSTAPAAGETRNRAGEQWRQEEEGEGTELRTDLQFQRKAGTSLKRTCNL
jgi:hypothetical protein